MSKPPKLLAALLRDVSRSFYLTLRVLPGEVRAQIGLAYLLARAADTIADTGLVPLPQRFKALRNLRLHIRENSDRPLNLDDLITRQDDEAEEILLTRVDEALAVLAEQKISDQHLIIEVLMTIIGGQELDLQRFADASETRIVPLRNDGELDDYTYRVAGCVGEFWTKICRSHLFPTATVDETKLLAQAVRFGKGLQLVNILRDLPRDLRQGRCYLPADKLAAINITPAELLDPANEARLRPLYDHYLAQAEAHLVAGWEYTNTLPTNQTRLRIACAWPILIGMKTLEKLRAGNPLDPAVRLKATRGEVRWLVVKSVLLAPFKEDWQRLGPQPSTEPDTEKKTS
ncbi:MAG: squalene/phytoene synthase family protein [Pedosphaera sp.]|nr:squalene/phytoene synthase family protein [Pedosphaera sp.]MST00060.1 squalene/phytoene synthase family protein [Pedosphaera sp.]